MHNKIHLNSITIVIQEDLIKTIFFRSSDFILNFFLHFSQKCARAYRPFRSFSFFLWNFVYVAQTFFVELQLDERIQQLIWNIFFSSPFFQFFNPSQYSPQYIEVRKYPKGSRKKMAIKRRTFIFAASLMQCKYSLNELI